jgi:hypothetical protein
MFIIALKKKRCVKSEYLYASPPDTFVSSFSMDI